MPGMIAMKVPMALQRSTSHQCVNVSRTPCHTPPSRPTSTWAMLEPWMARSMTSGIAKKPIVTGTRPMPSHRKS